MVAVFCLCGQRIEVGAREAGETVRCDRCGASVAILAEFFADAANPQGDLPRPSAVKEDQPARTVAAGEGNLSISPAGHAAGLHTSSPYKVLRLHAHGGMGRVSVARDERLRREVALKELPDQVADDAVSFRRFIEEAKITGQLEHPGVVPVYALGTDSAGRPYYAMKLVHGRTLREAIDAYHRSPIPAGLRELLRRFVMVCQTVAYAHARGIIHRDLKPENVMLGEFGETLVLDWGLAKPAAEIGSPESTRGDLAEQHLGQRPERTEGGVILGTPAYMSPEQATGETGRLGPPADVYSLGAVLYHVLTGRPAYRGGSPNEIIAQVKSGPPAKPSQVRRGVPRPLEAICLKAMARQPDERYPTATMLADEIQSWLDDEPVAAYPESRIERLCRWTRHHKTVVANGVLVLLALILVISVVSVVVGRARARTQAAEQLVLDLALQAEEAEQQAAEKEQEASWRFDEAEKARSEAAEAIRKAVEAARAADAAKTRAGQLEAQLKIKTEQSEDLKKRIEQARAELDAAEARVAAQTERAEAANRRVESLEEEAASLRQEAQQLRTLAGQLAQLAAGAQGAPQLGSAPAGAAWEDFTERGAAAFDVTTADKAFSILSSDTSRVHAGRRSLRLDTLSGSEVWVTYPNTRDAGWDLSSRKSLSFTILVDDANTAFRKGFPRIRIGRGSSWIQLEPQTDVLGKAPEVWSRLVVPLAGDATWKRTQVNSPDLSHVDWLEICIAGEKRGFAVRFDALGFEPPRAIAPFDAERARQYQEAWANYLGVPVEMTNSIGMKLLLIPPGEFMMGSAPHEVEHLLKEAREKQYESWYIDRLPAEAPRHPVRITRPFYLGATEVTAGVFRQFVEETGYRTEGEKDRKGGFGFEAGQWVQKPEFTWRSAGFAQTDEHPVIEVSWNDAVALCQWLSGKEGAGYAVPSEAQWEYACRAGTTTRWSFGDQENMLSEYAWWSGNSSQSSHPVGQKKSNAWGLFDMHGNVWEWCADWYATDYYAKSPTDDPTGPDPRGSRVLRGGAWSRYEYPPAFRCACRRDEGPELRDARGGFRVVCEANQ